MQREEWPEWEDCFGIPFRKDDIILYPRFGKMFKNKSTSGSVLKLRTFGIAKVLYLYKTNKKGESYTTKDGNPVRVGITVAPIHYHRLEDFGPEILSINTNFSPNRSMEVKAKKVVLRNTSKIIKLTPDMASAILEKNGINIDVSVA